MSTPVYITCADVESGHTCCRLCIELWMNYSEAADRMVLVEHGTGRIVGWACCIHRIGAIKLLAEKGVLAAPSPDATRRGP